LVEADLLSMVRGVSEDKLYDTIEFNEFFKMMSKQQSEEIPEKALVEAFN
jgi:Ca2+-binding EF-hand superfamily protein